ncbi:ankyrin repeat protein [Pandoravirus inopinatum]|uniref:Ankyrin repeat protein n=1 Tax=Pandoravirus inopinatum TaxID=1605721 RepID=A0A0B5J560_9VIRU|nr:ankyrin repeat protein [Pandoravirus inopinatum]AJF96755.1 ankyrin repeat protein [Pandoravirus inopinatum]
MQETACGVGLARLPPELMDHIASFLPRVADIAACLCASPLFRPMRIDSAVVRLFGGNVVDVIERGAPLAIVEVVRGRSPATDALLLPAVRGGRLDVLERFCGSPMRPLFCTPGLLPDAGLVRCYSHDTGLVHWGYAEEKDHRGYPSSGVGALFEAIACGRADMVDRLLDFGAIASVTPPPPDLGVECMLRAARKGHLDVMQVIHRRIVGGTLPRRASSTAGCGCAPLVGQSAFNSDQPEAAEWLDRCGCDGAYRPVNNSLGLAVEAGHFGIARWLIDKAETHGAKYDVGPFSVFLAAKLGAAAVVALVYDWYPLRHQDSDPDRNLEIGQVLAEAAARGHMDILRWAAGDPCPIPTCARGASPCPSGTLDARHGGPPPPGASTSWSGSSAGPMPHASCPSRPLMRVSRVDTSTLPSRRTAPASPPLTSGARSTPLCDLATSRLSPPSPTPEPNTGARPLRVPLNEVTSRLWPICANGMARPTHSTRSTALTGLPKPPGPSCAGYVTMSRACARRASTDQGAPLCATVGRERRERPAAVLEDAPHRDAVPAGTNQPCFGWPVHFVRG